MIRRMPWVAGLLSAACTLPLYATFDAPVTAGAEVDRVAGQHWSIVPPRNFAPFGEDPRGAVSGTWVESPPANGANRVYRKLQVSPLPAIPEDEPAAMAAAAAAILRSSHATSDRLEVVENGTTELAGRPAWFQRGRKGAGAADLFVEVLDFYVTGSPHGLWVSCSAPPGQLADSRTAFEAVAATLQTDLGPPPAGAAGELHWDPTHSLGLRLPADWAVAGDPQPAVAAWTRTAGGARCELFRSQVPAAFSLDAQLATWTQVIRTERPDFELVGHEWRRVGNLRALRLRGVYTDDGDLVVTDQLSVLRGDVLWLVSFRLLAEDLGAVAPIVDRTITSVQLR